MKHRDWLIQQGLSKPGARGRLSKDAVAALNKAIAAGTKFTDWPKNGERINGNSDVMLPRSNSNNDDKDHAVKIKSRSATHEYSTVYGIDTRLRRPVVIAFQWCAKCLVQVRYCSHDIPQLPEYMGGGNAFITKPTETDLESYAALWRDVP